MQLHMVHEYVSVLNYYTGIYIVIVLPCSTMSDVEHGGSHSRPLEGLVHDGRWIRHKVTLRSSNAASLCCVKTTKSHNTAQWLLSNLCLVSV